MSYTKTNWVNDTEPAINDTNLNKIEQGIYDNDSHIGDITQLTTTANTDLVSAINEVDSNTDINTAKLNGTQVAGDMVVDSIRTKNMLDTAKFVAGSSSVRILDANNGTLEIQSTSGYYSQANSEISLKANTPYTISYNGVAEQTGSAVVCAIRNLADSTTIARQEGTGDKTLTFTTTENGVIIRFMVTSEANTGKTKYTNIQLEEGSTATTYTPYQELNNQEVYSTGETRIGTWTDGKPLYRKVYTGTLTGETTNYNYAEFYLPTTIETLVRLNGTMKTNNSNSHYIKPFPASSIDINHFYNEGSGRTRLYGLSKNEMPISTTSFIAIAEYTKTTD